MSTSWLSSLWDFDKFNFGKMWDSLEDDPWRLLAGAQGPLEVKIYNELFDKDWEPWHNVLGGPYGSGFLGLGSGGIYDEYIEEGGPESQRDERILNKQRAVKGHDVAEVIVSLFGIGALAGLGGGGAGAGAGAGGGAGGAGAGGGSVTTYALPEAGSLGGGQYLNAAGEPIGGAAGGGFWDWGNLFGEGGSLDFASMDWSSPQTWMQMGEMMPQGGMGGMGGRTQEPQASAPPPVFGPGGYVPDMEMAMRKQSPPRYTPFGLLNTPEEQEMMKQALGGLL